jgi:hypothetical protein
MYIFAEKYIPFMNSTLWGPRAAPNQKNSIKLKVLKIPI